MAEMYSFPTRMTPHPELAWACVAVDGVARARLMTTREHAWVTTAGTNRDFSCARTVSIGGSAWVIRASNAKAIPRMRRNESVMK